MTLLKQIFAIIHREIRINLGNGGGAYLPSAFFAGSILMVPFALGPDSELLRKIGPGYLWLGLALACLVSLDRLFQADLDDGSFDQIFLFPIPLSIVMLAKLIGQFIAVILPLLIAMPIGAILLNIEAKYVLPLLAQLFIGAFAMFLTGGIGAALGAGIKRGGLLVALLALPLYAPILIFGASSANIITQGMAFFNQGFLFVCMISLFGIVLSPLAIASAMRLHAD